MYPRRKVLLVGVIVGAAILSAPWWWPERELIYRGESVKAWIRKLEGVQTAKAAEAAEAKQVLIELGSRGVPWMIAELDRTRPTA